MNSKAQELDNGLCETNVEGLTNLACDYPAGLFAADISVEVADVP